MDPNWDKIEPHLVELYKTLPVSDALIHLKLSRSEHESVSCRLRQDGETKAWLELYSVLKRNVNVYRPLLDALHSVGRKELAMKIEGVPCNLPPLNIPQASPPTVEYIPAEKETTNGSPVQTPPSSASNVNIYNYGPLQMGNNNTINNSTLSSQVSDENNELVDVVERQTIETFVEENPGCANEGENVLDNQSDRMIHQSCSRSEGAGMEPENKSPSTDKILHIHNEELEGCEDEEVKMEVLYEATDGQMVETASSNAKVAERPPPADYAAKDEADRGSKQPNVIKDTKETGPKDLGIDVRDTICCSRSEGAEMEPENKSPSTDKILHIHNEELEGCEDEEVKMEVLYGATDGQMVETASSNAKVAERPPPADYAAKDEADRGSKQPNVIKDTKETGPKDLGIDVRDTICDAENVLEESELKSFCTSVHGDDDNNSDTQVPTVESTDTGQVKNDAENDLSDDDRQDLRTIEGVCPKLNTSFSKKKDKTNAPLEEITTCDLECDGEPDEDSREEDDKTVKRSSADDSAQTSSLPSQASIFVAGVIIGIITTSIITYVAVHRSKKS